MQIFARAVAIFAILGCLTGETEASESKFYRGTHLCNGALTLDDLFALLGAADPTVGTARAAAAEQQRLPPIALLPELDQQAYRQRYAEAAPAFWKRFYEAERKRLAEHPVETSEDRMRLVAQMRDGISAEVTSQGSFDQDSAARQSALDRLRLVADRLADRNSPLQARPMDGLCERISGFNYIDTDRLELAVGLPVEYWDRGFTEDLLGRVQACKEARIVVHLLTQSYPEIEKRARSASWLREQRKRLLALPLTLAAFRDTNGLHLNQEDLRRNDISRSVYERFVGSSLDPRRAEMERAAVREVEDGFARETPASLPPTEARARCQTLINRPWGNDALARLFNACTAAADGYVERTMRQAFQTQVERIEAAPKTFEGLRTHNGFLMDTTDLGGAYPSPALVAEFNGKVSGARAEAIRVAKAEVERAFAAVDPLVETPDSPILQCGRGAMPSDVTLRPLVEACSEGARALNARREAAQCEQALKASGATDSLRAGTIRSSATAKSGLPVHKVVCGGARQKVSVTFPASGMLWWSKQFMEVRLPDNAGQLEPRTIRWLIEPVAGSNTDWALTKIETKTIDLPGPQEAVLSCLAQEGFCR